MIPSARRRMPQSNAARRLRSARLGNLENSIWSGVSAGALRIADPLDVKAEVYERPDFGDFYRDAWRVVEPAAAFHDNWHLDAISEHLIAVTDGQIRQLIISMPPRSMKSLLVSVFWPAWLWTFRPWTRMLWASYVQKLSTRDTLKTRRLIDSPWYRTRWGRVFSLTTDQNEKMRYENNKTGYRIATSVEGSGTGEGGAIIATDDPHNVREVESESQRSKVHDWWDQSMSTRGDDPKTAAFLVVAQRTHVHDLTGHLLEQGGWEELVLPEEYDPKESKVTVLGWEDPRTEKDELLWPARMPLPEVEKQKRKLGSYQYAAQYQQAPRRKEGYRIMRGWFDILTAPVPCVETLRAWDLAGTKDEGDSTSGTKMGIIDPRLHFPQLYAILNEHGGQWSSGTRDREIRSRARLDGVLTKIWGEQEPGSGGKDQAFNFRKNLAGFTVYTSPASHKLENGRADPFIAAAEAGLILIVKLPGPAGDWVEPFLDEICDWPYGDHDDKLSSACLALAKLSRIEDELEANDTPSPTMSLPSRR